jgi:hypothetical protein
VGFRATTKEGQKAIHAVLGHTLDQMDFEKMEAKFEAMRNSTNNDDDKDEVDRTIKALRRAWDQTYVRLQDARDFQLGKEIADVLTETTPLPSDVLREVALHAFSYRTAADVRLRFP